MGKVHLNPMASEQIQLNRGETLNPGAQTVETAQLWVREQPKELLLYTAQVGMNIPRSFKKRKEETRGKVPRKARENTRGTLYYGTWVP